MPAQHENQPADVIHYSEYSVFYVLPELCNHHVVMQLQAGPVFKTFFVGQFDI